MAWTFESWTSSLAGDAVARGVKVTEVEIDERGRRVASLTTRDAAQATPFPFALGLEQSRTEQLLADRLAARSCPVRWNTSLEALTATTEGAEAVLHRPDGAEHVVHARWVVGADGARCPVHARWVSACAAAPSSRAACWPMWISGHTTNPQTSALRSDVDTLLQRYAVPSSVHEVPAEETHLHACYGATAPQLVLIRPDGHIAYKGAPEELEQLKDHLDQLYVRTEHGVRTSR